MSSTMFSLVCLLFMLGCSFTTGRLAGECATQCNDLRFEVLTLEMCREARRTLPRPKVGDFCSTAMEQGFNDACINLCMEQPPVNRVANVCRSAAIEMPRPTVRKWCEHGYNVAFRKAMIDLTNHFRPLQEEPLIEENNANIPPSIPPQTKGEEGNQANIYQDTTNTQHTTSQDAQDLRPIIATIPVTLDDHETKELVLHEGQNAEEAVVEFCREYMSQEVSTCIRQLLPVVIDKLAELNVN